MSKSVLKHTQLGLSLITLGADVSGSRAPTILLCMRVHSASKSLDRGIEFTGYTSKTC